MEEDDYLCSDEEFDNSDQEEEEEDDESLQGDGHENDDSHTSWIPQKGLTTKVITKESLLAAQKEDLRRVMDMLFLREHHARTLLIHHRWDVEKLFAVLVEKGRGFLFAEAGVSVVENQDSEPPPPSSTIMCAICIEDVPGNEATTMDCGHCFCNGSIFFNGEQLILDIPNNWSGRLWGRQGCCFDPNTGKGTCLTGDCAGFLQCKGLGGVPPATLVEITLGTPKSPLHFYDVSLIDGFNVTISMVPVGGNVGCGVAACEADLNVCCPLALVIKKQGRVVGCKSACLPADI